jgi:hypothetical protein
MIRKLLALALVLMVGSVAYAATKEGTGAAPARKSTHRSHRAKTQHASHARSHRAHHSSHSSRQHAQHAQHAHHTTKHAGKAAQRA